VLNLFSLSNKILDNEFFKGLIMLGEVYPEKESQKDPLEICPNRLFSKNFPRTKQISLKLERKTDCFSIKLLN